MNIEAFLTLGRQKSPGFYALSEVFSACKGGHNLVYLAAGLGGMFSIALKGFVVGKSGNQVQKDVKCSSSFVNSFVDASPPIASWRRKKVLSFSGAHTSGVRNHKPCD